MLRPQYTRRPFEVLVIGPKNSGKNTITTQLLKTADVFYSVNTADNIPKLALNRIDFILILVDMTQSYSLSLLNTVLQHLTPEYILNKTAIVATKADLPRSWQLEREDIDIMVKSYFDLPILFVNLTNEIEKKRTSEKISNMIKLSTLQYKNVSSTLIKSLYTHRFQDTVLPPEDDEGYQPVSEPMVERESPESTNIQ
ncbi:hypothetical protein BDF20DRAFT_914583 [Mycotypha africana]|uniref:uncharacterized protein n=1 Tax=Mycotypha africana TaxID=64632 RepID=UPI002300C797|nr:uncharacterized protein BDF20DRAFT_914583 [Mycotypha africana]KAI8975712.1 hypothetical protein BDF20DRAFT_914583 [Mycotypha africana]